MSAIPTSADVLVILLLLVLCLLLALMILSRRDDARLEFFLGLIDTPPATTARPNPEVLRSAPNIPEKRVTNGVPPQADDLASRFESRRPQSVWQELPVVFAAALRGRAM